MKFNAPTIKDPGTVEPQGSVCICLCLCLCLCVDCVDCVDPCFGGALSVEE